MHFKRSLLNLVIVTALVTTVSFLTIFSSTIDYNVFPRALSLNVENLRRSECYHKTFAQEVEVDATWVNQRQALIEAAAAAAAASGLTAAAGTPQAPRKVTRILIVTYMRGGSTLFGELFNRFSNDSLYWFEPVDAFYVARYGIKPLGMPLSQMSYLVGDSHTATFVRNERRKYRQLQQLHYEQQNSESRPCQNETDEPPVITRNLNADELAELTDFLVNTLTCEFRRLPLETFVHGFLSLSSFMNSTYTCLQKIRTVDNVKKCSKDVAEWCGGNDTYLRPKIALAEQRRCAEIINYFRTRAPSAYTDETIAELNSTVPGAFVDKRVGDDDKNVTVSNRKTRVGSTKIAKSSSSLFSNIGASTFFNRFRCLDQLNMTSYGKCIRPAEVKCHNEASLIVAKAIRVRFSEIEQLIKRIPDIHVIHLVRDPRAIVLSRVDAELTIVKADRAVSKGVKSSRLSESAVAAMIAESKHLCRRMSADLRARRRLEIQYPGAIFSIRYEDLTVNPRRRVSELFNRIGIAEPNEKYYQWLRGIMFGRKDVGVNRVNATATAEKWKHRLSYQQAVEISRYCNKVLAELGYNS